MAVFELILNVMTKIWVFLSSTKMPLFTSLSILQFLILTAVIGYVIDFIVGLVNGSKGGKTGKGGVTGD